MLRSIMSAFPRLSTHTINLHLASSDSDCNRLCLVLLPIFTDQYFLPLGLNPSTVMIQLLVRLAKQFTSHPLLLCNREFQRP